MLKNLTIMSDYTNAINRGLPFFTKDELDGIESKYEDGMTWDEIEFVMSGKGTLLKHSTFRKYIQDEIIPKAKGHKTTESGRVAIYDSNIISHLNFVSFFYKVADAPMIDELIKLIGDCEISYADAIESVLEGSGVLCVELVRELASLGGNEATDAIEKALTMRQDKDKVLEMFNKVKDKFEKYVAKDLSELEKYLESHIMLVTQIPEDDPKGKRQVQL